MTDFERHGRVWLRNAIPEEELSDFDEAADLQSKAGQRLQASDALRRALSPTSALLSAISKFDPEARPVRVVGFNKSEAANWAVPWHQDRVIAVANKADVEGFGNWTRKSGIWHCEPPQPVLDAMLLVRVHLDRSDGSNGAMEIAVGSHDKGIVPGGKAMDEAHAHAIEICEANRGDVLVLKMLTLHCSRQTTTASNRRVLRIDFASSPLPEPLNWNAFGDDAPRSR